MEKVEPVEQQPEVTTRFVRLDKLRTHGRLPRFGTKIDFAHPVTGEPNANLCEERSVQCCRDLLRLCLSPLGEAVVESAEAGHPDDECRASSS